MKNFTKINPATESDRQLINRALKNDQIALALLVKRHLKLVYNIARSYAKNSDDAEDIAQETFVKIWKNLKKFNREKSFTAWISTITKNTALDWLKKKKSIPFSRFENENGQNQLAEMIANSSPASDELADKISLSQGLQNAIAKLPLRYQEIVIQHGQKELTFQEIADSSSQSINTVKSRFYRALNLLRKHLFIK